MAPVPLVTIAAVAVVEVDAVLVFFVWDAMEPMVDLAAGLVFASELVRPLAVPCV